VPVGAWVQWWSLTAGGGRHSVPRLRLGR